MALVEVLDNLNFFTKDDEKNSAKSELTTSVTPSQERDNNLFEEDSADKDPNEFDLKDLDQRLLCAVAETYRHGGTFW